MDATRGYKSRQDKRRRGARADRTGADHKWRSDKRTRRQEQTETRDDRRVQKKQIAPALERFVLEPSEHEVDACVIEPVGIKQQLHVALIDHSIVVVEALGIMEDRGICSARSGATSIKALLARVRGGERVLPGLDERLCRSVP